MTADGRQRPEGERDASAVRDPLAVPEAVTEARSRPMSERLEQALSWNSVAAELRAGMAVAKRSEQKQESMSDPVTDGR
ncbi:MAG TPA: hypothetical protein VFW38_08605 [Solirubrobacteraceae bacterium]|nr:hypothetical protein [Solirubrobacteraceae bacterium]